MTTGGISHGCPCCGGSARNLLTRKWQLRGQQEATNYDYALCDACGHFFVSNPPDDAFLKRYYETLSQTLRRPRGIDAVEAAVFANQAKFMGESFAQKNVLEIGCDTGQFLDFLNERGATTFFDELSQNARKILFERKLHREWKPGAANLDWIVVRHTLEHIRQPLEWLFDLPPLNRTGSLFIEVPDWTHLDTDTDSLNFEHLHQYTTASMAALLQRAGYAVEAVEYAATPGYPTTWNRVLRVRAQHLKWDGDRADMVKSVVEGKNNALVHNFSALLKQHSGQRVAVYAASWHTRTLCLQGEMLPSNVYALYDSDPAKHGSDFSGFVVRTPEDIVTDKPDAIVVLSSFEQEIERYLREKIGFTGAIIGVSLLFGKTIS